LQTLEKMIQNTNGEMIFNEQDVCHLLMQGRNPASLNRMLVDSSVNIEHMVDFVDRIPEFVKYSGDPAVNMTVFDQQAQARWHMPEEYKQLDIAEYVLGLCSTEAELQRVGHELLLYQERDLFNLLRYLKYLVDVMKENHVIWGVGRGSSVASYVLYKLGVHRIDSMFYNLEPEEFLR
jgi:DNA polymerase III alpha subunit